MKKITLLLAMLVVSFGYSQTLPIDFEESDDSNIIASVSDGGTFNIIDDADNTGESVGQFSGKVGGALYDHINVPLTTSLDIAATNTISFRVKQTTTEGTTSHLFKLQPNGGTGSNQEVAFTTEYDVWKDVSLTYSGTGTYNELIIFFDFNSASVSGTYLIDDIVASSGTPPAAYDLPFDFETSPVTSDWAGFEGAGITVEAVAAPQTTGNSSTNLAKIIRNGGQPYAGVVTTVDTALDFSTKSTITARIWTSAPIGTKVMFKTENAANPGDNSGEKDVFTTKTGEWEDLVFDFATVGNTAHTKLVIIPDNGNLGDGSATSTFYFDDIIQAAPTAASQTITVSIDVSADPGGVNIVTPTVSGNWAEYAATVDPNNANKYSYTFAEGVTSAEFVWKVYGTSAGDVQESLTSLVGGGAIENNLAATLPTGNGINTDYSTYCNRTVASDSGDFVAPTFVFNSFRQVGVTYTELVLTADSGDSYAIDYSVNDYSEFHGPGATDNGDGTYTVIVNPSSAFTYLWYNITTSTQEDLSACDSSNRDHAAGDSEANSFGVCPTTATGNSVTVATSQAWNAYVNAFNVSDDAYAFGFPYTVSDLRATPTATSMTLEPNTAIWTAEATNAGWFDQGAATQTANKYIEALSYIEDATLANEELTFSGNISVSDLGDGYTVVVFIKTLTSSYTTVAYKTADISSTGDFTVTATADEMSQAVIQYGFSVTGPLADPADTSLGSVVVGAETLSIEDINIINVSVYPNPSSSNWNFRTPNTVINSVEVFNLLGKRVASQRSNNSTNVAISTQGLTSGIYIARITTEQGTKSVKLIKN
ncbi:T9SS type A sorting domain-containing protein [Flavobacteriaceae bacterium]|nr:T9SS type A sorting domain-containing protein [Flavobacteriaceae bacterium]